MASTRDEKSHKCDFCTLKLENYHLLCQHLLQFHNIAFIQCEYCHLEFPSKSELVKHVSDRHTFEGKPRVECSICPGTFMTLKGLMRHMNQNHKTVPDIFPCKKCHKKYRNRSSLLKHIKLVHKPLTYIKCDKCPKIFYKRETLKIHYEVEHNTNFKKMKCPLCPTYYKYRSNLGRHIKDKHYANVNKDSKIPVSNNKCNLCSELFTDKTSLLEHRKTFHNRIIDIFSCDNCTAVFKLRKAYENHLWEEHGIIEKDQHKEEEEQNYLFQDYVDFETIMLEDFEMRQIMKIRQSRKFSQKLVILSYKPEEDDDDDTLDVKDTELDTIIQDVNSFFKSLINPPTARQHNINVLQGDENCDNNQSGVKYLEIQITEKDSAVQFQDNSNEEKTDIHKTHHDIMQNFPPNEDINNCMQTPKIMFNCMECPQLFSDEDLLWNHLTEVHKKSIKRPESAEILGNLQNDFVSEGDELLSKDDNYTIHNKNEEISPNTASNAGNEKKSDSFQTENELLEIRKVKSRMPHTESSRKASNHKSRETSSSIDKKYDSIKNDSISQFECTMCTKTFKMKVHLTNHVNYTHSKIRNKKVGATEEQTLSKKSKIDGHREDFSSNRTTVTRNKKVAYKQWPKKSKIDVEQDDSNLMFPCEHCQALFPCRELLLNHCLWQHN